MAIAQTLHAARPALHLLGRLVAAVPAGYGLMALAVALMGRGLAALGLERSEAVVLAAMLGFILYLVWLMWAFAVRRLRVLWLATAGGIGLGAFLLWWGA